jgi:hypothetical protein
MSNQADARLEAAARHVREYGMSDANLAWIGLCDALVELIKGDLLHAPVESVPGLQAQARQLNALKSVAQSSVPFNGRA